MPSAGRIAGLPCNFIQTEVMPLMPKSGSKKLTRRIRFSVSRVRELITTYSSNGRNRRLNAGSVKKRTDDSVRPRSSADNVRKEPAGQRRSAARGKPKLNACGARKPNNGNDEQRNGDSARKEYAGQRRSATVAKPKNACGKQPINRKQLNHMKNLGGKKTLKL